MLSYRHSKFNSIKKIMLARDQILYLKSNAHELKPVVIIGQKGITDSVIDEIKSSLDHHELLKVKVNGANKDNRDEAAAELCRLTGAEFVQMLGNVLTLFKQKKKDSKFVLPKH